MTPRLYLLFFIVVPLVFSVDQKEKPVKDLEIVNGQIVRLKQELLTDVTHINREVADLKERVASHDVSNLERNEQVAMDWMRSAVSELRAEMKAMIEDVNNSDLLRQLREIRNELAQVRSEAMENAHLARAHESRLDKLEREASRLKYDHQQMRRSVVDLRLLLAKQEKELRQKYLDAMDRLEISNEVSYDPEPVAPKRHAHRHRHSASTSSLAPSKMVHTQISRLARTQNQLECLQQNLQTQILDVERRIDRYEEPNWKLMSAKIEFLELENKDLRTNLQNASTNIADLNKVHASIMELREEIEGIEHKADSNYPEIRKEISKLDVNYAQMNAQVSYLKEDQENLRQSVKAIAVSVSNVIERAEQERAGLLELNNTVNALHRRAAQHYTALNDHIMKSEANYVELNETIISLPQLMGEVKELVPVEREYEDLVKQLPKDCALVDGPPGVYLVHPRPDHHPADAWCDNGTTVIQRRFNGSVEFNRKYREYVEGFGPVDSEFWLGLAAIHAITDDNCTSMRIDMTDIYGAFWYAEYEYFYVGSADHGFVLDVSGFSGNASDAFQYQNGMEFSAIDLDRDISNTHCASNYEGGWWYSHCQHVNINGKYSLGLTWFDSGRNEWIAVASSEMRLFRRSGCKA